MKELLLRHDFWRFTLKRPGMLFGLGVIVVTAFLAIFGEFMAPYPVESPTSLSIQPPGGDHWFGTDVSGLDVFSRTIAAPRIDLAIALISTALAFIFGVMLGVISGFFAGHRGIGDWVSVGIMRAADILQAFPIFIFALALVGFSGPSARNVIIALAFLNIPFFLRLTRGSVLQVRDRTFVEAAIASGNSDLRTAFVHVMPNALTPALVNFSTTIGFSILLTAGLSFVGAGVPPPTPEWGLMIKVGAQNMMTGQWWTALFPGIVLGITILGYSLFADNLRIYMDPVNRR